MKKVLLFGATGSVGVYTAIHLSKMGYTVIAVGKRESDNNFFANNQIQYISLDIHQKEAFSILPTEDIDTVIHFAGSMPARMIDYSPYSYIESIIVGTLNILEFMRVNKINKIVFAQSISDILYKFGSTVPISADIEQKFPLIGDHSIYSISKNAAVNIIEHYYHQYGIKRFILRLPTIYLYHPNPFYYVNGIKKWMGYRFLIHQAIQGNNIELWGDPNSKKEIVYVKDFTHIVEKCVESKLDGGIYNIGRGVGVSMIEQIKGIIDVFCPPHKKSNIIYKPEKPSSPQFILDISKSIKELNYHPQYDYLSYLKDFKIEMEKEPFSLLWGKGKNYLSL